MTSVPKNCFICKSQPGNVTFNKLDMLRCPSCGLIWRSNFELPHKHYQEKKVDLSVSKLKARLDNCLDRINTFGDYISLNNLCDLGTGEGMFLKALNDSGYKNGFGIEPSSKIDSFAIENNLDIYNGTIEDLTEISRNRKMNCVSMFHLIEHLDDPKRSFSIIYDALPNGGYLIMETPDSESYVLKRADYEHELIYPEHLFLYNPKNMSDFLKSLGFNVVALGRRDFNPNNLNIRDLLFKLGITKYRVQGDKMNVGQTKIHKKNKNFGYLRYKISRIVKWILGFFVEILGRGDYFWIIAKK